MTDTQFYEDMVALATELMNDFGTPATLRKVAVGSPGADGKATKTTEDHPGLAVRISDQETIRALELVGDRVYALKFPATSDEHDLLIHHGETMELTSAKLINPEGDRLILAFAGAKMA